MDINRYSALKNRLLFGGYEKEIEWAANLKPCDSALDFWAEYSWVILNSGMKNQVAKKIWERILESLKRPGGDGDPLFASRVFGHKGKANAIETMWAMRITQFYDYQRAADKMKFLQSLPWIGPITKYHLAKNLGHDCVKPDRHLVRIAKAEGKTPDELCRELSQETGDRLTVVDSVLWRAANLGLI